jgi:hypothetical protein
VLDDVQGRRFLVEPAGEDPLPAALRGPHAELDEGAGQLLDFPGRGRLAGAKANDGVADPNGLPGFQGQVSRDAVALVEEAEHRHALRHRRGARRDRGHGLRNVDGAGLARGLAAGPAILVGAAIATGERGQDDEGGA